MQSEAVQEALLQSSLRVAWLLEPIGPGGPGREGRAGQDVSHDRVVTDLAARFNAIPPYLEERIAWHQLAAEAAKILESRSKDIGVAAYLAVAWVHRDGLLGLLDGLVLLRELGQRYWYWLYPPVAKPRSRGFVVEWLTQQTASLLYREPMQGGPVELQAVHAELDQLDVLLWDKLGDHYRGAKVLRRSLDAVRLRLESPHASAQLDQHRWALARALARPNPPAAVAPPVVARARGLLRPVQQWKGIRDLAAGIPDPEERLRALHSILTAKRVQARNSLQANPHGELALEREIVALSHQLGILPGAPSSASAGTAPPPATRTGAARAGALIPEADPFTPAPPAERGCAARVLPAAEPAARSMRGAAARNEPLPPEGAPVEWLHLTVHVREVPSRTLLRSLRKEVPYRIEIALEPVHDPQTLAEGQLRTTELFSEAALPELSIGLEATGALLAFPDHPGSVGPRLVSDTLPCSLSAGTKSFQFDIMATGGIASVDVTVWLRQEVLVRARVALPCMM